MAYVFPVIAVCIPLMIKFGSRIDNYFSISDFGQFYLVSKAVITGDHLYSPATWRHTYMSVLGIPFHQSDPFGARYEYYSPSAGFLILPISFFSYRGAEWAWFFISIIVLEWGLWQLINTLKPDLSLLKKTIIVIVIMCSSSMRWPLLQQQMSPLIFGILALFISSSIKQNGLASMIYGSMILWLKPTFWLPVLGLSIISFRPKLIVWMILIWIIINSIGFYRMGGTAAFHGYIYNISHAEVRGQGDYPDPYLSTSSLLINGTFLFRSIFSNINTAHHVADLLCFMVIVLIGWECIRGKKVISEPQKILLFTGPLIGLTLFSVYHQFYDANLLLLPLMIYYLSLDNILKLRWVQLYSIVVVWYCILYMKGIDHRLLFMIKADQSLLIIERLQGSIITFIALITSYLAVHVFINQKLAARRDINSAI